MVILLLIDLITRILITDIVVAFVIVLVITTTLRVAGGMMSAIGVSKRPGAISTTRTPRGANSRAAGNVSDARAPFDAAYAPWPTCRPSNAVIGVCSLNRRSNGHQLASAAALPELSVSESC